MQENLKIVRWGLSFSLLAVFLGFLLGGVFGGFEDALKTGLQMRGEAVLQTVYESDSSRLDKVLEKSWVYFKRAHMHAAGIGTASLSASLLLSSLGGAVALRAVLSGALGLGALGYSSFWLLAGLRAPALGSTGLAKESLTFLAVPSAASLLLGFLLTLGLTIWTFWLKET